MPNIKTFDAGVETFHPSEAGSAAWREAGGVAAHMANATAEQYRQLGRNIGSAVAGIGSIVDTAQAHTDAMAEIDFQNQLTNAEIAAQGGVNMAGTPKAADGTPIYDNPGRGVNKSLPPDASVPSPGQYSVAASDAINDHGDFLDNLVGRLTGTTVSQKARDRMAAAAEASKDRLRLQANAIAGEVAFTHATHTTEQTLNQTIAAVRRGDMPLPDGMDQIGGAMNALRGSLSGKFSAEGAPWIENNTAKARQQAIVASIEGDLANGHPENAMRTLNDPQWDADIGGMRTKIETEIRSFQNAQVATQETARKLQQQQQKDAALARTDQYVVDAASPNPQMKLNDIWNDPAYANRPDLRKEAVGVIETMRKFNTQDLSVSPELSHSTTTDLMKGITAQDGDPNRITDRRPIDQAFIDGKLNRKDYTFALGQLKAVNEPAIKNAQEGFKAAMKAAETELTMPLIGGMAGRDPKGRQAYSDFYQDFTTKYQNAQRAGTLQPNALDFKDPNSLISKTMAPYKRTNAQKLQDWIHANTAGDDTLQPTPGHNPDLTDVDPQLLDVVREGAATLPPGYRVTINEGYNAAGHVANSQHHIKGKGALDVQIWGPDGKAIPNKGEDATGMYANLARGAYQAAARRGIGGQLAWGGRFGTTETSNVPDLMHFDLGGDRGHFGAPLAERFGARAIPEAGTILQGYRFKGGDPSRQENWAKVQ